MNKDIRKNREALIRHFYSLPKPDRKKITHYFWEGEQYCLCAKGQLMQKFFGADSCNKFNDNYELCYDIPDEISEVLEIGSNQWREIEDRYEGRRLWVRDKQNFSQIADWLQTLPGWPRVL